MSKEIRLPTARNEIKKLSFEELEHNREGHAIPVNKCPVCEKILKNPCLYCCNFVFDGPECLKKLSSNPKDCNEYKDAGNDAVKNHYNRCPCDRCSQSRMSFFFKKTPEI